MNPILFHPTKRTGIVRIQTPFIALVGLCLAGPETAVAADANKNSNHSAVQRPRESRLQKYFVTKEREARSLAKQLKLQAVYR